MDTVRWPEGRRVIGVLYPAAVFSRSEGRSMLEPMASKKLIGNNGGVVNSPSRRT